MKAGSIGLIMLFCICFALPVMGGNQEAKCTEGCKTCIYENAAGKINPVEGTAGALRIGIAMTMAILISIIGWKTYHKKKYLIIGSFIVLIIGGSYVFSFFRASYSDNLSEKNIPDFKVIDTVNLAQTDEFLPVGAEFGNQKDQNSKQLTDTVAIFSEFSGGLDDFSPQPIQPDVNSAGQDNHLLYRIIVLLALSALLGILIQYRIVRRLRGLITLSSVVYLGFIEGACPCMIMSLQNVVLYLLGNPVAWVAMAWFLGLIPITYFFGKTWCGWLCHLGGLQEFLYKTHGLNLLTSAKSQSVIKFIQSGLFIGLLVQLAITHSNLWVHYDPFKVVFNLMSANTVGYVLLVLLLISSVLVYRPFCRIICPVGLILGWVTLLPGARKLQAAPSCNNCRNCVRSCKQNALSGNVSTIKINTEECILCSECLGQCKRNSLILKNKKL